MKSQIPRIAKSKPHQQKTEHYGTGMFRTDKGVVVCQQCHNAYYKKQWHHPVSSTVKQIKKTEPVNFSICPACSMINNRHYAGEIIITNVPQSKEVEMVNMITGFNLKIQKRDPQHRVIHIDKDGDVYRVTTTEDQMAVGLAKKIQSSFDKKAEMSVSFSHEPFAMVLIHLTFSKPSKKN